MDDRLENPEIRSTCARLAALDNDSLYALIADPVPDDSLGASKPPPDEAKRKGKVRWRLDLPEIRQLLCGDARLTRLRKSEHANRRLDIAAVAADLLLAKYQLLPACALAVLIVRESLDSLCSGHGQNL